MNMAIGMKALQRLQAQFIDHLLSPAHQMDAEAIGTTRVSAADRLAIYARGYRLRLIEVLENDYPGLLGLMGDEDFTALCLAYIDHYPSQHFSVRWFGQHMPRFLVETSTYAEQPHLAEMATFEWALGLAFDAADTPILNMADLATLPAEQWPELRLSVHSSVQRLEFYFNIPSIWQAIKAEQESAALEKNGTPVAWLVWRHELKTFFRSLAVDEVWVIDAIIGGECFAEICAGLCQWHTEAEAPQRAVSLLQIWIAEGLLQEISIGD